MLAYLITFAVTADASDVDPEIVIERGSSRSICNSSSPFVTPWDEGTTLRLNVQATDTTGGGSVHLNGAGFPVGMQLDSSLPVSGQPARLAIVWSPTYAEVGLHAFALWAVDSLGHRTDCPVKILVRRATTVEAEPVIAEIPTGAVNLGTFTATLTEQKTGLPVAGRVIAFRIGADAFGCSAVTDEFGVASCGNVVQSLVAAQGCGYFALFTAFGDPLYGGSVDRGPIVRVAEVDSPC